MSILDNIAVSKAKNPANKGVPSILESFGSPVK